MEKLERTNSWKPTVADSTAKGSYRMQVWRTDYGIVTHRATVDGKPVAYTSLRSTYRHEADSIIGFQMLNDPAYVTDAATFQQAASTSTTPSTGSTPTPATTAYYNSGMNPVRAAGVDAALPVKAEQAYEWQGYDPAANTTDYTPFAEHPQSSGQDYYISWNNRQAKDYSTAGVRLRRRAPRRPARRPGVRTGRGGRSDPRLPHPRHGGGRAHRPARRAAAARAPARCCAPSRSPTRR